MGLQIYMPLKTLFIKKFYFGLNVDLKRFNQKI